MAKIGQPYTSGNWMVREGNEEEFVTRWTEFTEWSLANAPGAETFLLIRDATDPRHFNSFGSWEDAGNVTAWRDRPEFQERLAACRALCDDFKGTDFTLSAAVGA
ncbi:MAG TPA: antibiotic biosynthesis monooxygenase family protein [Actinomycetota bacterium]|jgi:heme-degrading monooxygenase HmoA